MRAIYNILFLFFFLVTSPYYFYRMWRRGNWKSGFSQRFGEYDSKVKQSITNRQVLWMHAVSVGEMNVCVQVIRELEPRLPNLKIVVSTTTTTGMGELQKRLQPHIGRIYFPIDRRKYVCRALTALHPVAIALVESEIWPNFIWRAHELNTPLFLINARLSDRSYPRYRRLSFLFRPLFSAFNAVGAQNEADAAKLLELGCETRAVEVVGNLKFDAAVPDNRRGLDVPGLLSQLGVMPDTPLLVAGSTHAGEEEMLAEIFVKLRATHPALFLVLVPRHFERAKSVGDSLTRLGIKFQFRSKITGSTQPTTDATECLLVDTTGELRFFYEHATVVFVGKSLAAKGGQNPIEPAAFGKPVIFGPNMQNFSDVVRIFLAQNAAIQVSDPTELERTLDELLTQPERRQTLGHNALRVVQDNQGAVARTVDMIVRQLEKQGCYVAPVKSAGTKD